MFAKDGRVFEINPSTVAALYEHTLRTSFMAGYVAIKHCFYVHLSQTLKLLDMRYEPRWMQVPEVSIFARELIKIGCNTEKRRDSLMQVFVG